MFRIRTFGHRLIYLCLYFILILTGCENQPIVTDRESLTEQTIVGSDEVKAPEALSNEASLYYLKSADKSSPIIESMIKRLKPTVDGTNTLYFYQYFDLNKDGVNESVILIMNQKEKELTYSLIIVDENELVLCHIDQWTPPVIVGKGSENEYAPLYMSTGRGSYARIDFDGKQYQLNRNQSFNIPFTELKGIGLLSDVLEKKGFRIK